MSEEAQLPQPVPAAAPGSNLPTSVDAVENWVAIREQALENTEAPDLPPLDKAAIILAALGPDVAGEFIRNLSENDLTRVAIAISRIDKVERETLDAVMAEFVLSIGTEEEVSGGLQTARKLLATVLDENTIEKIMFDVEGGDTRAAWKKLNDCTAVALAGFIGAEHPQTAAVILSELRAEKAAAVIERLDPEFSQLTLLRLARVPSLDSDVAARVERVISRDFLSVIQAGKRSRKPADVIAGLMNNLGEEPRTKFLDFLETEKPTLHRDVLKTMFTFADIRTRVQPRDLPIIIKEIEEPMLITALKYGRSQGNATTDFILENLSKRLSERLAEDVDAMPDVSGRDGEAAHQEVVRKIQDMAKLGTIELISEDHGEEE